MSSEKKEYQWDTVLLGLVSNRKNEGGKHTTKSTHSSLGGFFFFFFLLCDMMISLEVIAV